MGYNASLLIQGDPEAIDFKHPAVTICPKVSTKYGIAERLGNYIDPNKLPEEALSLKREIFKCRFDKLLEIDKNYNDENFVQNDYDSGWGKIQMPSTLLLLYVLTKILLFHLFKPKGVIGRAAIDFCHLLK